MSTTSKPQIVVGGHICLDVIPALNSTTPLDPGRLIRVGAADVSTGGAVANVGVALHRLGVPVRLMGTVANDLFGGAVLDVLRRHDPSLAAGMRTVSSGATSYSIVISPPMKDRTFLHCPGVNATFTSADIDYDRLRPATIFHFGYPPLMPAMCANDGEELIAMFRKVRALGIVTSLDMSLPDPSGEVGGVHWPRLLERVLPHVDIFLPSVDETLFMLDRERYEQTKLSNVDAAGLANQLLGMGPAVAGLKLGDQGLFIATSDEPARIESLAHGLPIDAKAWTGARYHSPCYQPKQIAGTTGSGDCTIAGFLAAMVRGAGASAAADAATAVGACSVEAIDATSGVMPWPIIEKRMAAGWPRLNHQSEER